MGLATGPGYISIKFTYIAKSFMLSLSVGRKTLGVQAKIQFRIRVGSG